jgi:hypothetical protein
MRSLKINATQLSQNLSVINLQNLLSNNQTISTLLEWCITVLKVANVMQRWGGVKTTKAAYANGLILITFYIVMY